jgi:hypothetical protein
MLFEGKVRVGLQMPGQPRPQGLAFHRWSARDLVDVHLPCLMPPFEPALDGRAGEPEEVLDPLLGTPRSMAASAFDLKSFE